MADASNQKEQRKEGAFFVDGRSFVFIVFGCVDHSSFPDRIFNVIHSTTIQEAVWDDNSSFDTTLRMAFPKKNNFYSETIRLGLDSYCLPLVFSGGKPFRS